MSLSLPLAELARGAVIAVFFVLLAIVSVSDVRNRKIPNWSVLAICALAVPWILLEPNASFISSGEAILVTFLISFPLYLARLVGAGNSKLLMAVALLVGASNLMLFLLIVATAGGVIAAGILLRDPTGALVLFQMRGNARSSRGVPYGVAIAIGAAAVTALPPARQLLG